jgi:DNA-binding response OmpR family regulator
MKRAWVFEDEEVIREFIALALTEHGYLVSTYESPYFVQESEMPDLLISDNRMPYLSGMDYVRQMWRDGVRVQHIALMSGDWANRDVKEAESMGCKIFYKPFHLRLFHNWLTTLAAEPTRGTTMCWTNMAP